MRAFTLFLASAVALTALSLQAQPPQAPVQLKDAEILDKLIEALRDTDPDVRQNLSTALSKFGQSAVEPLVKALASENAGQRAGAAYTLAQLGNGALPALPKLLELLKDSDLDVRRQSSLAVSRILVPQVVPVPPSVKR
jgi:HEAT repeat protein